MLKARITNRLQTLRTKPMLVFAVLLVAGLQLSIATHQFDHVASDLGDVCSYCVQLDRLDDVISTESIVPQLPATVADLVDAVLPRQRVKAPISSQPRAPPYS